jgi:hypothetical protein
MRDEPPEGHPGRAGHLAWAREVGGPKGGTGYAGLRDVDVVSACSMLARWSAVREVGFWDDRFFIYCDDADWCWRMRRAGWRVVLNLDAVVYHTPWFAKLTPARAYYAQRNLLWMLGTNHPQPRETVRRRIDAICRDAWRHALRRRGLHAEALRRACADACRGVSGKAKGLDPVPLDLAGELSEGGQGDRGGAVRGGGCGVADAAGGAAGAPLGGVHSQRCAGGARCGAGGEAGGALGARAQPAAPAPGVAACVARPGGGVLGGA